MIRSLHLVLLGSALRPRTTLAAVLPGFLSFPNSTAAVPAKLSLPPLSSRSRTRFTNLRMSYSAPDPTPDAAAAAVAPPAARKLRVRFCQSCGNPTTQLIPDGDEKLRAVCTVCGIIHYENPKMVVGCLVEHKDKILLCKRKIEPSYGLWTLPAGFLEIGESAAEGAARETLEEACAEVEVVSPFAQLDIPHIGQSYIIFRAKLKTPHFSPGPESLECALFPLEDVPFDSLAFSSIIVTLKMYIEDIKTGGTKFHYCTVNKRPGASPSDPHGFDVDQCMHS